jgi:hypothetical protein
MRQKTAVAQPDPLLKVSGSHRFKLSMAALIGDDKSRRYSINIPNVVLF